MNCYIFDVHIDCCFYHNNSRYDLLELGPLNMINSNLLIRISTILQGISSHDVPRNWWTDFSSWSDLRALLRTGTLLPIHRVLQYINQSMEALTNYETSIQMIDGNGDIEFSIPCISQVKLKNTPTCAVAPQFSCCTVEKGKKHFLNIIRLKLLVA